MKDEYVLLAAVAVMAYGLYTATTKKWAGYNVTSPPVTPVPKPRTVHSVPGVSSTFLQILANVVDTPGGVLAGPLSPVGFTPEELKDLVNDIIERLRRLASREVSCTWIDGGTCYATSDGDKQYDFTCHLHDRETTSTIKIRVTMIRMRRGDLLLTTLKPHDSPNSSNAPVYEETPPFADYSPPVSGI